MCYTQREARPQDPQESQATPSMINKKQLLPAAGAGGGGTQSFTSSSKMNSSLEWKIILRPAGEV